MEIAQEFIAGWFAGCAGVVVSQPLDTVKVRLQVLSSVAGKQASTSTFSCFMNIVKNEKVFGLFKGMAPPLAAVALQNAMLFGVYGNVLNILSTKPDQKPSLFHLSIAATAAGVAQVWVVCPMELVKIKLQMQTEAKRTRASQYRGSIDCVRKIYKTTGVKGIFQGMFPLVLRDVPGFVVYFGSYEILLDLLAQRKSRGDVGPLASIFAGGLAGMLSWTATFPMDVVKSRIQADGNEGKFVYKDSIDCFVKSYRSGGIRSLYTGLGPSLLRAFPTNGIIFFVYNLVSNFFSDRFLHLNTNVE